MRLARGPVRIDVAPARGGGLLDFWFDGEPVFAPVRDNTPTGMALVPLLPFANRIAQGRFRADGRVVQLPGDPHALHGHGWNNPWTVTAADSASLRMTYDHAADAWPWDYRATQHLALTDSGYRHSVALRNLGPAPMPAGIGLHPWFPLAADTVYRGRHRVHWPMAADMLPGPAQRSARALDPFGGQPVAAQRIDDCFGGRHGPLTIDWPGRGLRLVMRPSASLRHTHVYVPDGAGFFCVEPVSHSPDAVNRDGDGLVWLAPGRSLSGHVDFAVSYGTPPPVR